MGLNAQDLDEERKRHGHEVDEFRRQLSQVATALWLHPIHACFPQGCSQDDCISWQDQTHITRNSIYFTSWRVQEGWWIPTNIDLGFGPGAPEPHKGGSGAPDPAVSISCGYLVLACDSIALILTVTAAPANQLITYLSNTKLFFALKTCLYWKTMCYQILLKDCWLI